MPASVPTAVTARMSHRDVRIAANTRRQSSGPAGTTAGYAVGPFGRAGTTRVDVTASGVESLVIVPSRVVLVQDELPDARALRHPACSVCKGDTARGARRDYRNDHDACHIGRSRSTQIRAARATVTHPVQPVSRCTR